MNTEKTNLPCNETPAGCRFVFADYNEGEYFISGNCNVNIVLYCSIGSVTITSTLFNEETISEGDLVFIPRQANFKIFALKKTHLIIHLFDHTTCHPENCILKFLFTHKKRKDIKKHYHCRLDSNKGIQTFMDSISIYLINKTNDVFLWNLKHKELIWMLSRYYPPLALQSFFHPMIDEEVPFKSLVLSHCMNARTAKELAEMCGYGLETFRRLFNKEFQVPIYKWIQIKKTEQVRFKLSLLHLSLKEIAEDFGMSPQQLNRFCKEKLGDTPGKLRKQLKKNA